MNVKKLLHNMKQHNKLSALHLPGGTPVELAPFHNMWMVAAVS